MRGLFDRTLRLLGDESVQKILQKRVIIFGVGGVGSWCAESLVRTGISHLTIVDFDCVSESNINRQLMATYSAVGRPKVEVLRERLLDINPDAEIVAIRGVYNKETAESYDLGSYDYVIDCIDSLKDKIDLLVQASHAGPRVFSSMGAALKMDTTHIRVGEFWKVRGCPLGAAMRKRMHQQGLELGSKVMCVFSEELLENKGPAPDEPLEDVPIKKVQVNGSLAHITGSFGFTLAGLVLQDIVS